MREKNARKDISVLISTAALTAYLEYPKEERDCFYSALARFIEDYAEIYFIRFLAFNVEEYDSEVRDVIADFFSEHMKFADDSIEAVFEKALPFIPSKRRVVLISPDIGDLRHVKEGMHLSPEVFLEKPSEFWLQLRSSFPEPAVTNQDKLTAAWKLALSNDAVRALALKLEEWTSDAAGAPHPQDLLMTYVANLMGKKDSPTQITLINKILRAFVSANIDGVYTKKDKPNNGHRQLVNGAISALHNLIYPT